MDVDEEQILEEMRIQLELPIEAKPRLAKTASFQAAVLNHRFRETGQLGIDEWKRFVERCRLGVRGSR